MAPSLIVVAGPNGAGKSSFVSTTNFGFPVLDPDAIAGRFAGMTIQRRLIEAGRAMHGQAEEFISSRKSFVIETTLAGKSVLAMVARAKSRGMRIVVHYIALEFIDLSKLRVKQRVEMGGHGVSDQDVELRFPRSLANLRVLAKLADEGYVYDNSRESEFRLMAEKAGGKWIIHKADMSWITDGLNRP